MQLPRVPRATLVVAAVACFALSGCLVAAPPPGRPIAYASGTLYPTGYDTPVYHEGYAVHFDTVGSPYYYSGRSPRYVPRNHPRYAEYVRHRPHRYRRY